MQEPDDIALLREFAERNSEEAFAAIVSRHVNKVYSVALRHTRNPHQAEEITQAVFVIFARKAHSLRKGVVLSGWLHETTRLTAVTFIRSEIRRAHREREACVQNSMNETDSYIWAQIASLLDAAMARLSEKDRYAVVLRFFDEKSMREVGVALGANEDAAKKRVNRAVDKLRAFFGKRGIVTTAAVLTEAIAANSVQAAPATLAKSVTAVAFTKGSMAAASTTTLVKGTLDFMLWLKTKTAVLICAITLTAAGGADIAIKQFSRTPGGAQTMDALHFLVSLQEKRQLPGYALKTDVGAGFMIPGLHYMTNSGWQMSGTNREDYPVFRTFDLITNASAGAVWHYTVVKESKKDSWQLQKAWQTDHSGKITGEFPLKSQQ